MRLTANLLSLEWFKYSGPPTFVNCRGLKAAACGRLLRPLRSDVFPHGCFVRSSDGFGKIAISPEAVSPKEFLQLRIFFPDHLAGAALEILDRLRQRRCGAELEEHVHMVRYDGQFMDIPPVHFAALVEQVREPSDELPLQDTPAVFRHEDNMVYQAMERMASSPEHGLGHTFIVAQWAEGIGLSPALKRGACAFLCQN